MLSITINYKLMVNSVMIDRKIVVKSSSVVGLPKLPLSISVAIVSAADLVFIRRGVL